MGVSSLYSKVNGGVRDCLSCGQPSHSKFATLLVYSSSGKDGVRSINYHCSIPIGVIVKPRSLTLLQINTAMAPISGELLISTGVRVGELCARTIVIAPPGIVDEVATVMVKHGIVNRCVRIPIGRVPRIT